MAGFPEIFDEEDHVLERRTLDSERPLMTPPRELLHGDGYRWASLDVADLDPPTSLPPY